LAALPDARRRTGRRYALPVVLLLIVLAKLAGEDRPSGIADWVQYRGQVLRQLLHLAWPRMPHHNTYRRILAHAVPPADLDRLVSEHLCHLPGVGHSQLLALDGKTVRGTIPAPGAAGTHLLAAYLPAEGIVLLQVAVSGKENEISMAPDLLAQVDLRGKVVCADALHTQRALSAQIVAAGGDYLWLAKANQPALQADIALLFSADDRTVEGGRLSHDFQVATQVRKGHGRREQRQLTASRELTAYSDWPHLAQVFQLVRRRTDGRSGASEQEVVYGLTSLPAAQASPGQVLALTQQYWGIENGLHRRRDVTFQEDHIRLTQGQAGHVLASLTNLVIGLLRHAGETNLAAARRRYAADLPAALALLAGCPQT
jgi:predicted transposase YbfD/YdcC